MTTVVTLASGDMRRVWDLAAKTWQPYCERHGYSLKCYTELPRPDLAPSWNKVPIMLMESKYASGPVWWVDSDMTVAKQSTRLPDLDKDVSFSTDWNGICAGMFGVRSTEFSAGLLKAALLCGDVGNPDQFGKDCGCKWEQNAFKVLLREFPSIAERVGTLPLDFVNDQPHHKPKQGVIYHFGGRTNEQRVQLIKALHHL